jgi:hypothetical protein
MPALHVSQKQIDTHIGQAPIFDPAKDERPQILRWLEWSAKMRLFQALSADQEAKNEGHDPDEDR